MHYVILSSSKTYKLQDEVNEHIDKGYKPLGGMCVDDLLVFNRW